MRTLPPEICTAIFALCAEHVCGRDCASTVGPDVLSRVCRRWRVLTINNPCLWTKIHVRPRSLDIPHLWLWLEHSANLPLHITVCPEKDWDAAHAKMTALLLQQFFPYFHRVQSFSMCLTVDTLPTLFGLTDSVRLPCLRDLDLLVDDPHIGGISPLADLIAPKLERLRIRDITLLFHSLADSVGTITSLTIEECTSWKFPHTFPYLLASCVQLQTCSIIFPSRPSLTTVDSIELPELRSLTLEWPVLFHTVPFFSALRAPKLRTLHLVYRARHFNLPRHVLASLCGLAHSAPRLRELSLEGCHLPHAPDVHALLAACRALERLAIVRCRHGERFLAPLTPAGARCPPPGAARDWLCPRLTHVAVYELHNADVRSIVRFARARSDPEADALGHGARYLQELALHTEVYALTRHARLLMMSGLLELRRAVHIVGPFGELLDAT